MGAGGWGLGIGVGDQEESNLFNVGKVASPWFSNRFS